MFNQILFETNFSTSCFIIIDTTEKKTRKLLYKVYYYMKEIEN